MSGPVGKSMQFSSWEGDQVTYGDNYRKGGKTSKGGKGGKSSHKGGKGKSKSSKNYNSGKSSFRSPAVESDLAGIIKTAQASALASAQGHAQPSVQGHAQPSVQEHAQPSVQGHAQPSVQGHAEQSVQGHTEQSVQEHAQASVLGHTQPSVLGHSDIYVKPETRSFTTDIPRQSADVVRGDIHLAFIQKLLAEKNQSLSVREDSVRMAEWEKLQKLRKQLKVENALITGVLEDLNARVRELVKFEEVLKLHEAELIARTVEPNGDALQWWLSRQEGAKMNENILNEGSQTWSGNSVVSNKTNDDVEETIAVAGEEAVASEESGYSYNFLWEQVMKDLNDANELNKNNNMLIETVTTNDKTREEATKTAQKTDSSMSSSLSRELSSNKKEHSSHLHAWVNHGSSIPETLNAV